MSNTLAMQEPLCDQMYEAAIGITFGGPDVNDKEIGAMLGAVAKAFRAKYGRRHDYEINLAMVEKWLLDEANRAKEME